MPLGHAPAPSQVLRDLLAGHPQAASLQAEASSCRALVLWSAAKASRLSTALQATRLDYERLRERLDPRCRRPVRFGQGLLFLGVLGTGLTVLDAIDLSVALPGVKSVLPTLAATVIWLTFAWFTALVGRQERWAVVAPVVGGGVLLALLLAALHGVNLRRGWPVGWEQTYRSTVSGLLLGACLLLLAGGAAVLVAHLEPASVAAARHRCHRARARYEAAAEMKAAHVLAASIAKQAWLGLVRSEASAVAHGDTDVVRETVALAVALLEHGRPGLPPPLAIV